MKHQETLELRCSELPLAFICPGSVRPVEVKLKETNDAADLGTAAHVGLAHLVRTGSIDWDGVDKLAEGRRFDKGELRGLLASGAKLWEQVKASFPMAIAEVTIKPYEGQGFVLTGHADVWDTDGHNVAIADWKGGRLDSDYRHQLLGYAFLALSEDPIMVSATAGVLWVRDGDYEHYSMDRGQSRSWLDYLVRNVVDWDGTYRPGSHCGHCKRNHECPAANALMRRDLAAIVDSALDDDALSTLSPNQWTALVAKAGEVIKLGERVRGIAKQRVIEHGDIVGTTHYLTLQTEERRRLKVIQAFDALAQFDFTDEDMAKCIDISASKAEEVVKARAPKGKGAAAARELKAAFEAAGAIETTTITKMVQRRN